MRDPIVNVSNLIKHTRIIHHQVKRHLFLQHILLCKQHLNVIMTKKHTTQYVGVYVCQRQS